MEGCRHRHHSGEPADLDRGEPVRRRAVAELAVTVPAPGPDRRGVLGGRRRADAAHAQAQHHHQPQTEPGSHADLPFPGLERPRDGPERYVPPSAGASAELPISLPKIWRRQSSRRLRRPEPSPVGDDAFVRNLFKFLSRRQTAPARCRPRTHCSWIRRIPPRCTWEQTPGVPVNLRRRRLGGGWRRAAARDDRHGSLGAAGKPYSARHVRARRLRVHAPGSPHAGDSDPRSRRPRALRALRQSGANRPAGRPYLSWSPPLPLN